MNAFKKIVILLSCMGIGNTNPLFKGSFTPKKSPGFSAVSVPGQYSLLSHNKHSLASFPVQNKQQSLFDTEKMNNGQNSYRTYAVYNQQAKKFKSNYTFFKGGAAVIAGALLALLYGSGQDDDDKESVPTIPIKPVEPTEHRRLVILMDSDGTITRLSHNSFEDFLQASFITNDTPLLIHENILNAQAIKNMNTAAWDIYKVGKEFVLLIPHAYKNQVGDIGFQLDNAQKIVNMSEYKYHRSYLSVFSDFLVLGTKHRLMNKDLSTLVKEKKWGSELVPCLEQLFENETTAKKYRWNVAIFGHGGIDKTGYVVGMHEDYFKSLLNFLDTNINTHSLLYDGCFSGGTRFEKLFDKPYSYAVFYTGGIDGFGYDHTESLKKDYRSEGWFEEIAKTDVVSSNFSTLSCLALLQSFGGGSTFVREPDSFHFHPIRVSKSYKNGYLATECDHAVLIYDHGNGIGQQVKTLFMDKPIVDALVRPQYVQGISSDAQYTIKQLMLPIHGPLEPRDIAKNLCEIFCNDQKGYEKSMLNKEFIIESIIIPAWNEKEYTQEITNAVVKVTATGSKIECAMTFKDNNNNTYEASGFRKPTIKAYEVILQKMNQIPS